MPGKLRETLAEHCYLFASFDDGDNAEVCRGDGRAAMNSDVVEHVEGEGRWGGALVFSARDNGWAEDEFRYSARDNFPYRESSFDGSISIWLCGDPDADLAPEYPVDPFHISRHPADASFYLDLTRPDDWRYGSPRKLRFGFYNDSPQQNMFVGGQLIVVGELGWHDSHWHHVVATWRNANSGRADGEAAVYIDGRLRGTMRGYQHQLSWDVDHLHIGLGQRYVGKIDELLICDVALSTEEVAQLYALDQPLKTILC